MRHIKEEQISAYLDGQVNAGENRVIRQHLEQCANCRSLFEEMRDLNGLFQNVELADPSPFLWNRIAANFDAIQPRQRSAVRGWAAAVDALRRYAWNPGFAAAAFAVVMFAGIAVFKQNSIRDQAALAEINRVYQGLAAQNPDASNPFSSGSPSDFDNPFRSVRRGRNTSAQ